jgi:hypothetical protein
MPNPTTAGRLLASLHAESPEVCDAVAAAAGLSAERVTSARTGALRLSLSEQLRLSEATALLAPSFTPDALGLRAQVLSARSAYSADGVDPRRDPVNASWDRAGELQP